LDKGSPLLVEDQGGEEKSPISDNVPPLSVKDRGVMRKVQYLGQGGDGGRR